MGRHRGERRLYLSAAPLREYLADYFARSGVERGAFVERYAARWNMASRTAWRDIRFVEQREQISLNLADQMALTCSSHLSIIYGKEYENVD